MKLKRLFQVLVLGGSTLVALSACGSDSPPPPSGGNVPPPQTLLPDGGTPPPGYDGPLIW
jgi:hypothetical protein